MDAAANDREEKQCRICFDGPDPELGRLIRPCLCKGSISYVHVRCLQKWRSMSPSSSTFYACNQCHYRYRFARTKIVGLATNPIAIAVLSTIFFVNLVILSSFITTIFFSPVDEPELPTGHHSIWYSSWSYSYDIGRDLIRAMLGIIQDETGNLFDTDALFARSSGRIPSLQPPGLIRRLFQRFLLGLPVVGVGSLLHMLSWTMLSPIHWLARFRGGRNRRGSSRDTAAIILVIVTILGAARALYKVYQLTESLTKRILLRAEEMILEVDT